MLLTELASQLSNCGCLADPIHSNHEYDRDAVLEFVGSLPHIHLLLDALNEQLPALDWFFDMLFLHFCFQVFHDLHGRVDTQISHDQCLFQLFVKIIVYF